MNHVKTYGIVEALNVLVRAHNDGDVRNGLDAELVQRLLAAREYVGGHLKERGELESQ